MPTCPRCGADATAIHEIAEVALPGGLIDRRSILTGWTCDNDHFLAAQEVVADPKVRATFRHARATDVAEVLALWQVAAENDSRPSDSAAKVETLIERDPEALELAIVGGRIVGSLISGWDGWRAHLYRLAVHPDARRRGIGRQLLARAELRLTSLGATRIDAMVLEHNELGQSIWAAEHYVKQPEWRRWVHPLETS